MAELKLRVRILGFLNRLGMSGWRSQLMREVY